MYAPPYNSSRTKVCAMVIRLDASVARALTEEARGVGMTREGYVRRLICRDLGMESDINSRRIKAPKPGAQG